MTRTDIYVLFAAIGLVGLGLLAIVPVFVRLLADGLHRASRGPVGVLTAGQRTLVELPSGNAEAGLATIRALPGVRDVVAMRSLRGSFGGAPAAPAEPAEFGIVALVGTCAEVQRIERDLRSCVAGQPMLLAPWYAPPGAREFTLTAAPPHGEAPPEGDAPPGRFLTMDIPAAEAGDDSPSTTSLGPLQEVSVLLPPDLPGLAPVLENAAWYAGVRADPGRELVGQLDAAGFTRLPWPDLAT